MHGGRGHWDFLLFFGLLGSSLGISLSHLEEGGVESMNVLVDGVNKCDDFKGVLKNLLDFCLNIS